MTITALNDPDAVREQYATETGLADRAALYGETTGPHPADVAFAAVAEVNPSRFLDVGCGTGWFAERVQRDLGADVVAIDQSARMVELARVSGVDARVADAQALPFDTGEFDCVAANWMLYHLPDLDRGLAELARVLRDGGRLVAVTNGDDNLLELWRVAGAAEARLERERVFSAENGAPALQRHFSNVEVRDARGTVTIKDREAIVRYLCSTANWRGFADNVPPDIETPLVARRSVVVFVATK